MLRCVVMHETRDYTHRHFLFVLLLSVSVLQKSWEIQCCPMHSKRAKKKKKVGGFTMTCAALARTFPRKRPF